VPCLEVGTGRQKALPVVPPATSCLCRPGSTRKARASRFGGDRGDRAQQFVVVAPNLSFEGDDKAEGREMMEEEQCVTALSLLRLLSRCMVIS
jgi:hypothetical protein